MLSKKVTLCGISTYQLPVLSGGKMKELFRAARAGDHAARQEIISGNLRLVLSVLQRFKNRSENPDDLFQVGCIGLLKAVDNFEPAHDVRFSTYAVPMIVGEIRRYLRDNSTMRVSRALKLLGFRAQQARERLTNRLLREPTVGEIAAELDVSAEEVVFACQAVQELVSLHEPVYNDAPDPVYILDLVSDQSDSPESWLEDLALRQAMDKLTERERRVLQGRFFTGWTQAEIASEIQLSQAQVSRIEKTALRRMRNYLNTDKV
jgi:RNA polymerase sporulation-specific sigma factor